MQTKKGAISIIVSRINYLNGPIVQRPYGLQIITELQPLDISSYSKEPASTIKVTLSNQREPDQPEVPERAF